MLFPTDSPLAAYTREHTKPAPLTDCDACLDGGYGAVHILRGGTKEGFLKALAASTTSEMAKTQVASTPMLAGATGSVRLAHRAAVLGLVLGVWEVKGQPTTFESGRVVYLLSHTDFVPLPWEWRDGVAPFAGGVQSAFERAKALEASDPGALYAEFLADTRAYYEHGEEELDYLDEHLVPRFEAIWSDSAPLQRVFAAVEAEHLSRFDSRWHSMTVEDFEVNVIFEHPDFADYAEQGILGRAQRDHMGDMTLNAVNEGMAYRRTGVATPLVQGWLDEEQKETDETTREERETEAHHTITA